MKKCTTRRTCFLFIIYLVEKNYSVHPLARFLPSFFRVKNLIQTFNLHYIVLVWKSKKKKKIVNYPPVQLKRCPHTRCLQNLLRRIFLNRVPGCPTYSRLSRILHVHQPHRLITLSVLSPCPLSSRISHPPEEKRGVVCVSSMNFTLGL